MTPEERRSALDAIADEVRACQRCRLAQGRTRAVPGEGSPDTEVVLVGEGPGYNEDQQGRPFVGAAGSFLDELIGAVGWRRPEVFITNVVKCRPPGNRDPEPDEMAACAPFLRRQLEVLDPALVVTLGRFSLGTFMPGSRIGQVHGTVRPVDPATGARAARALAMYHPAAALRATSLKETMRDDMSRVPQALIDARAERATLGSAAEVPPAIAPVDPGSEPGTPIGIEAPPAPSAVKAAPAAIAVEAPLASIAVEPGAAGWVPGREAEPLAAPAPAPDPAASRAVTGQPAEAAAEPAAPMSDLAMADVQPAPPADPIPDAADAIEAGDTLESLDTLVPLEVIGVPRDHPSETDQMQLFR